MVWLAVVLILIGAVFSWAYRFHLFSFYIYLSVQFEHREKSFQLLNSLRENLVHERKKKIAGLEMILSSWERGEEIQPKYEYFEELLEQLKDLVRVERRNLMATTKDIWLWGKLWSMLLKIQRTSSDKREKSDVKTLRGVLVRFTELTDQVVQSATRRFSFSLNDAVRESLMMVRAEKSQTSGISIEEQLEDAGENVRFSYDNFRQWQRVLTNLVRNAFEAVEAKRSGAGSVVADLGLPGGEEIGWVKITTKSSDADIGQAGMPDLPGISVIIEDSGIGMDEATKSSFYKKGFTSGKEGGLGLGVSEESVQFINQYGNWQVESQKGVGTKITINIDREKARKAELILPEAKRLSRNKVALMLSIGVFALVALAVLLAYVERDRNPAIAKLVDENTLVVEAKDGRFLWERSFARSIREACLVVADIDSDGTNEVLIGTMSSFKETGDIFCFSSSGKELWRFALGADRVFEVPSNRYSCGIIIVRDLNLDGEAEILVGGENNPWFPYQIAVLDSKGQLQTSYWHSGSAGFLLCEDVVDDGILEIVFGGVNNRLQYSAVLGVLDHREAWGQSPPYRDTVLTKAKEKIYIKFPFVRELGGQNDMYSNVVGFMYAGSQDGSDVYHVTVADPGFQREYHLDEGLTHVKDVVVHPKYRFVWEKMKREGMVDYDLSPEVLESWKEIEVWKNGVKVK